MTVMLSADKAKAATQALMVAIRQSHGIYDERIMGPLEEFLAESGRFKDAFDEVVAQSEHSQLAKLDQEIADVEEQIQLQLKRRFDTLLAIEDEIERIRQRIHLLQNIQSLGSVEPLLAFAQRTSPSWRPPPGWEIGDPLGYSHPPYPTEDMIRASQLYSLQQ